MTSSEPAVFNSRALLGPSVQLAGLNALQIPRAKDTGVGYLARSLAVPGLCLLCHLLDPNLRLPLG